MRKKNIIQTIFTKELQIIEIKTSAAKASWECYFPPVSKLWKAERSTKQSTNRQTDEESYTKNIGECWIADIPDLVVLNAKSTTNTWSANKYLYKSLSKQWMHSYLAVFVCQDQAGVSLMHLHNNIRSIIDTKLFKTNQL